MTTMNLPKPTIKQYLFPLLKPITRLVKGSHLSCHILSTEPLILVSYFKDFCDNIATITKFAVHNNAPVYAYFQLGFHVESDWRLAEIQQGLKLIRQYLPHAQFCFLANSPREVENLIQIGEKALFCHQNAFLDPARYPLIRAKKKYDAIYLARFTPAKRHALAAKIKSLFLIGDHMDAEQAYFESCLSQLSHASRVRKVFASQVSAQLAKAKVGLALSAEEGAMFVAQEYLLAGLPVVSTANLGGRHHLMPAAFLSVVDDCPRAIAVEVETLSQQNYAPETIRTQAIALMQQHKLRFIKEINSVLNMHGKPNMTRQLPHKLALRTRVPLNLRKHMVPAN